MNAENFDLRELLRMAHSPVRNYVLPGLTSSLIGAPSPHGTVRLFQNTRDHQETITPHSHRFDFQCWVLRGSVRNRLWLSRGYNDGESDLYRKTTLSYRGTIGEYDATSGEDGWWHHKTYTYEAGQCYGMASHEIHSIFFSRDAIVLFFEGPAKADASVILEPVAYGEVVPTFEVKSWMFQREGSIVAEGDRDRRARPEGQEPGPVRDAPKEIPGGTGEKER